MSQKTQMFNDGVVSIYAVTNIADPGSMPKDKLIVKHQGLRYKERTVGMGRYWTAMQVHARIDIVLRVLMHRDVSVQDVAVPTDGHQYKIMQVQYPEDIMPAVMDLSLQRLEVAYELA